MAIVFRGYTQGAADNATSIAVQKPSGAQFLDVLIAHVCYTEGNAPTTPAGWNRVCDIDSQGIHLSVFWKSVGASEPSSYTWTFSGNEYAIASISAYTGAHPVDPVIDNIGWNSGYAKHNASLTLRNDDAPDALVVSAFTNPTYQPHSLKNTQLDEADDPTSVNAPVNDYEAPDHPLLSYYHRIGGTPYTQRCQLTRNTKPRFLQVADQVRMFQGSSLYEDWSAANTTHPYAGNKVRAAIDASGYAWGCSHVMLLRPGSRIAFRASSSAHGRSNIVVVPRNPAIKGGDMMIAAVMVDENEDLIPGMPYGWTPLRTVYNQQSGRNTWYFWKVAGASEPDNYVWRLSDYYPNSE